MESTWNCGAGKYPAWFGSFVSLLPLRFSDCVHFFALRGGGKRRRAQRERRLRQTAHWEAEPPLSLSEAEVQLHRPQAELCACKYSALTCDCALSPARTTLELTARENRDESSKSQKFLRRETRDGERHRGQESSISGTRTFYWIGAISVVAVGGRRSPR